VLVVQLSDTHPPARLADWLTEAGAELQVTGPVDSDLADVRAVVCLGGPGGGYDPAFTEVRALLARAVGSRLPVLAVGLGAHLLAVAHGGQIRLGENGPEAGTLLVAKRDAAGRDPLFAELPITPDVVQFHRDEVHRLPPSAQLLAASTRYDHQAFRVGESGYGLQFHIESTPDLVLEWARQDPELAGHARPGQLDPDQLAAVHQDIAEVWQPFVARFVQLVRGELEPAGHLGRDLPLV
jgi:GMP synthase-like glutamine amidotransferase